MANLNQTMPYLMKRGLIYLPFVDMTDSTDYKILEILARNCRVTDTAIAKALGISKDTVAYRIAALERTRSIQSYVLFVDTRRLGFTRYHLLIRFESGSKGRTAIYESLRRVPFLMWINTFIGRYDIQVIVDATDAFHLNQIRDAVFHACNHRIKDYSILTCIYDLEFTHFSPAIEHATAFERHADSSFSDLLAPRSFPAAPAFKRVRIGPRQVQILQALADDPRATISAIAKQVNCDRQTVRTQIRQLIQSKIILNFGCIPNLAAQGFVTYYLLVRMDQTSPEEVYRQPFKKLRNIFYAGRMIGDYDMILYLNARSPQELNQSIEVLREELSDHMSHYDLLVQDDVHHWRQFTPGIYDHLLHQARKAP